MLRNPLQSASVAAIQGAFSALGTALGMCRTAGDMITRPGGVEPPASSSAGKRSIHLSYGRSSILAERLGFEPRVDLSGLHALSRRAPSTARPPLLSVGPCRPDAPNIRLTEGE